MVINTFHDFLTVYIALEFDSEDFSVGKCILNNHINFMTIPILSLLILVLRLVKIISLILSQVNHKMGRNGRSPRKTTCKQNLACLTCDLS